MSASKYEHLHNTFRLCLCGIRPLPQQHKSRLRRWNHIEEKGLKIGDFASTVHFTKQLARKAPGFSFSRFRDTLFAQNTPLIKNKF